MVDLAEIQAAYYMVAATGVLVAAVYYVMTLRTTQRNMKANLETRQAQFMNQISEDLTSLESQRSLFETMNMEWTDWEDFEKRWGTTGENLEGATRRFSIMKKFENVGWLLEKGFLDPEWTYSQFHISVTPLWLKYEPYVMQMRKKFNSPTIFIGLEYLGRSFIEIERSKGIKAVIGTTRNGMKVGDSN